MGVFYKIPKGIAEQVSYIEYLPGKAIDITAVKLKNNKYAIDEETIDLIKANEEAIMKHLPPNMRNKIRNIIDLDKSDHDKTDEAGIAEDLE